MPWTVEILNGPNLNLLGDREPEIYGSATLKEIEKTCRSLLPPGCSLRLRQSNGEGELIGWIHEARGGADALIVNAGALSHTSIAILDALRSFSGPVVEVHLSNTHKRESFRHFSYISQRADGVICGLGAEGYSAALRWIVLRLGGDV